MHAYEKRAHCWVDRVPTDYASIASEFGKVGSREWGTAVVLVASLTCGNSIKPLREHSGVSWRWITHTSWYLRHNGVWCGRRMRYDWNDDALSHAEWKQAFNLDVLAGCGYIRYIETPEGRTYRGAQWGDFS
jgi:hypothetical protein